MNRRKFVTIGLGAVGVSLVGGLVETNVIRVSRGMIRLHPVDGVAYSESFIRFMERAKFDSVRDAIASIRDRSVPVRIVNIGNRAIFPVVTPLLGRPPVC